MLRIKKVVNIVSFYKLHAFMKGTNKGYGPKKSLVFREEDIRKCFVQASDHTFLFLKVVVIYAIFGSCRRHEMCDLRMSDIKREGSVFIINIRPSKIEKGRKFAVVDFDIFYAKLFDQYISLRPDNISTDRVFLKYNNGKCIKQAVGINTFGKCPDIVVRFLDLSDAVKYTGHAFRRSSATIMANSGMSVDELKR
ncbi:phage integrase-related [Holotrichia oblita]|uniref:Phage integrase-related n=1 Tax=Holotrichia oblita TaxID=644536 RepID=A0ACB9SXY2_HOLOL|nr:phage integrase-related [Holotrichia oblita]